MTAPATRRPRWPLAAEGALFALAYFGAAELGHCLTPRSGALVTFWASAGLSFAGLVRSPVVRWPTLLVGLAVANVAFDLRHGKPLAAIPWFTLANVLEPALAAALLRRWVGASVDLRRLSDLFLMALVVVFSTAVGATVGAATMAAVFDVPFATAWPTWWVADLVGVLVVAPLVLALRSESGGPGGTAEGALLATAIVAIMLINGSSRDVPATSLLVFPLLIWSAVRFGWRAVAGGVFVLALLTTTNANYGRGYFAGLSQDPARRAFLVQSFLSICSLSFLALAAILHERREALAALGESNDRAEGHLNRLRTLIDTAPAGVAFLDPHLRFQHLNQKLADITDRPRDGHLGRGLAELIPPFWPVLGPLCDHALATGLAVTDVEVTGEIASAPGQPRHWVVGLYPVAGRDGRLDGLGVLVVDVTERKRQEEQLRQAQKMEAIGRLAGGIAHDFNNLLTVSNGYTDALLADLGPGAPMRRELEQVHRAGERAAALTRQLLTFSRQSVVEMKFVDLDAVVRESGEMLRRVIGEDIVVEVRPGAGPGPVRGDPGQLAQVLMNLVVNARDAMPRGGRLTIATRNAESGRDDDGRPRRFAVLEVGDTGCGIAPADRARLFEPFFTTKEVGKGTGLGLAVVHGIVQQCGGHITVASEPGRGATFSIYLPVSDAPVRPSAAIPDRAGDDAPAGATVLLVEDEDAVRRIAEITLRGRGYAVLTAEDAAAALELLGDLACPIDLLLTDVVMPGMSGRQLAAAARACRPELAVLYMSGYTPDTVLRHGVEEGDVHFLQKPFTAAELGEKVRAALAAPRPAAAAP